MLPFRFDLFILAFFHPPKNRQDFLRYPQIMPFFRIFLAGIPSVS